MLARLHTEIREVIRYRELLRNLVVRDIKVRYRRSFLGFLWVMLNPLLMMLVISLVFSELFKVATENYTIYLLSGIVMWNFFAQSTSVAVGGFVNNSSLIKKIYVPKVIFPLSMIFSALVNFVFSLVPLFVILFAGGSHLGPNLYLVPLSLVLVFLFALGIGMILSTFTVFFHDMIHIYEVILLAWMYATPVFYPESVLTEKFRIILNLNPMYHFLVLFRGGLFMEIRSIAASVSYGALFSLAALAIGYVVYSKYREKVIYYL